MMTPALMMTAQRHTCFHRQEILSSKRCGCFYCLCTFQPTDIIKWVDEREGIGQTALCPRCGIDSVLGSASGYPITPSFLVAIYKHTY